MRVPQRQTDIQKTENAIQSVARSISYRVLEQMQDIENPITDPINLFYEEWIEHPDGKARFAEIVQSTVEELAKSLPVQPIESSDLVISFRKQLYLTSQTQIWVGRHPDCDLLLDKPEYSRRQFVLVQFREFGVLVLISLGGHAKTRVVQRSDQGPCGQCPRRDRAVLVFRLDEVIELELSGMERMLINPKLCLVCDEQARSVELQCGHFATCSDCTAQLWQCPLCRAPIERAVEAFRTKTFVCGS